MSPRKLSLIVGAATVLAGSLFIATHSAKAEEGTPASRAYLHSYNLPSSGIALEGYCPVAYFVANKPVLGSSNFASTFNGVTYHFVNEEARKAFDKTPEKYIPAFGGWCAFGMSISDKFPVNPRKFKIVNGRLLVFLENGGIDALELWNKGDEAELLAKSEAHWARVTK